MNSVELSVVVPFYNEKENIASLHEELVGALDTIGVAYEIVYVNDGSIDSSDVILNSLTGCTVVHLQRSFGQTAALCAGFAESKGEFIATLDGDMQNDPTDLKAMVQYMDNNRLDMVIGWRKHRHDSLDKKIPSYFAYLLRQFLLHDGIHDAGCGIKVFRRRVLDGLELYGEMHRFFGSIIKGRGFAVGEYAVHHRARKSGYSKYSWKRGVKGMLDMLGVAFWGKFSSRPLHLLGSIGLIVMFLSILVFLSAVFHTFPEYNLLITQNWVMVSVLMFILGIQLVIFGLIADIAIRGYFAASHNKGYIVKNVFKNS